MTNQHIIELPCTEIKVGSLVVVNEFDRPCARLVGVLTELDETAPGGLARYLDSSLDGDYGQRSVSARCPTPIAAFGVLVLFDHERGMYCIVETGPSCAAYPDGRRRHWQENLPTEWRLASLPVVEFCLSHK